MAIWYRLRILHFYDGDQAPATPGSEQLRIDPVVLRGGAGAAAGSTGGTGLGDAGLGAPERGREALVAPASVTPAWLASALVVPALLGWRVFRGGAGPVAPVHVVTAASVVRAALGMAGLGVTVLGVTGRGATSVPAAREVRPIRTAEVVPVARPVPMVPPPARPSQPRSGRGRPLRRRLATERCKGRIPFSPVVIACLLS